MRLRADAHHARHLAIPAETARSFATAPCQPWMLGASAVFSALLRELIEMRF
jgi:hypothetical protein